MTRKKYYISIVIIVFSFITLSALLIAISKRQIVQKKATEVFEATFSSIPMKRLNRIWANFAQGGEEQQDMLKPVEKEIRKLQPEYIRIDHIYDFGKIVNKDLQGNLSFDFSPLDKRVEEIISLGAIPMLSLSYFPEYISSELLTIPTDLNNWEILVEKTIQRYSGKKEKNIFGIYYEVWNEPDNFGQMSPDEYFKIYESSARAANKCQDCNFFKFGGPAITTLKKDWMSRFVQLVVEKNILFNFISFHSYQTNPSKTLWEIEELKRIMQTMNFDPPPEITITEWGSTPENSPMHDSYFDASHTINAVNLFKNSGLEKLFAFELKDGPSPEGKQFWGRWGLLTHQSLGIIPKPRYYSFLYLDKLLKYELPLSLEIQDVPVLGSSNGKDNYVFVFANNSGSNKNLNLTVNKVPTGRYLSNLFLYDQQTPPELPLTQNFEINQNDYYNNINLSAYAIGLLEISRISASIKKGPGITESVEDFSSEISSSGDKLYYPVNPLVDISSGKISFSLKPNWDILSNNLYSIISSNNPEVNFSAYIETKANEDVVHLIINSEDLSLNVLKLQKEKWHQFDILFDNDKKIYALKFDEFQVTGTYSTALPLNSTSSLIIGGNYREYNFTPCFIDNLKIEINQQPMFEDNFN